MWEDPYAILGVPWGATQVQIDRAYKRLAFAVHPDRNGRSPGSAARFMRVDAAYGRVKDEAARNKTWREFVAHVFAKSPALKPSPPPPPAAVSPEKLAEVAANFFVAWLISR